MASLDGAALGRYCGVILVIFSALGRGYGAGGGGVGKGENNGCSSVKLAYGAKGLNRNDVPSKMISGEFYSNVLTSKPKQMQLAVFLTPC